MTDPTQSRELNKKWQSVKTKPMSKKNVFYEQMALTTFKHFLTTMYYIQ